MSTPESRMFSLTHKLSAGMQGEQISLGQMAELLATDGILFMILILIIPNLCPIAIPIVSTVTGLPILVLIIQALLGVKALSLPHFLAKRTLTVPVFKKVLDKGGRVFLRLEWLIHSRYQWLAVLLKPVVYVLLFIFSVLLALPIPGINFVCAVYLCLGVLGLLEEDGLILFMHVLLGLLMLFCFVYFFQTMATWFDYVWAYFF